MSTQKSKVSLVRKYLLRLVLFPFLIHFIQVFIFVKETVEAAARFITQQKKPSIVRTPEERFKGLEAVGYTFKSNYVELPIGGGKCLPRVHYLDEGPRDAKETILCLHGEPSWSFLYRKMIPGLVKSGYRVIAPDFIGFGKSDKYTHPDMYSHELHTTTLRLLLDKLDVSGITLVCQDWGGLTGLPIVKDCPHLFSRVVIMNTGLPAGIKPAFKEISGMINFLMWRYFVRLFGTSLPIHFVFKRALINPPPPVLEGYTAPFPSSLYKAGAFKWPQLVPINSHSSVAIDMKETRAFFSTEWKRPALIMFSDLDPITRSQEEDIKKLIPHAVVKPVFGAGHFLQEDKGEELATHVTSFIENKL